MHEFSSPLTSMLSLLEDKPNGRLLKIVANASHMLLLRVFVWNISLFSKLSGSSEEFWMRRYCEYCLNFLTLYNKAVEEEKAREKYIGYPPHERKSLH
jgi:hypothetical protein